MKIGKIHVKRKVTCPSCQGSKYERRAQGKRKFTNMHHHKCRTCRGNGYVWQ